MYKFQYKISILNFLTCANLHMIEKPKIKICHDYNINQRYLINLLLHYMHYPI